MTARLQLRLADESERELSLQAARAADILDSRPWRTFRSHRKQRHYAGADPDVVGIAAQPFLLIESDDAKARRHVPDFFLQHRGGTCTVVNVKPAAKLDDPKVAATLAWRAR